MLRLTLAQMRRSLGRLMAAGIAICIGTAFVAATLLAGNAITRTTYDAVTTGYGDADLVVSEGEITDPTLASVAQVPGVDAVHGYLETGIELAGPSGQTYVQVTALAASPDLQTADLADGTLPARAGQIALPSDAATLLGVEVGDTVQSTETSWRVADDGKEATEARAGTLEVVGLLDVSAAAFLSTGGVAVVVPAQLESWSAFQNLGDPYYWYALVAVADGTSATAVRDALGDALPHSQLAIRTIDEQAKETTAQLTGSADVFTAIVLGFAAVALLVAALVIANTFQVLVAQRTRTLALLRCVGADRAQLHRSVILEALILGAAASLAGFVLGTVVVQVVLMVLAGTGTDVPLPSAVSMTPAVVVAPLVVGTLVTVLAALSPARAATRVSPLAALRPSDTPRVSDRSGRFRAVASALLTLGGGSALVVGMTLARDSSLMTGLGIGVLGGALSFVGVLVGSVFWVPRLVGWAGALLGRRGGTAARLAAANSIRNPRRTAATSAALFIGVTLVSMMATGAASTRIALDESLDQEFSVDVAVGTVGDGMTIPALPAGIAGQVRAIDGVASVAELTGTMVEITSGLAPGTDGGFVEARGVEPAAAGQALKAPEQIAGLDDSTVIVPRQVASWTGLTTGQVITLGQQTATWADEAAAADARSGEAAKVEPLTVEDPVGTAGGAAGGQDAEPPAVEQSFTVEVTDLPGYAVVLTPRGLASVQPDALVSRLWIRLSDDGAAEQVVGEISTVASESGVALETVGAAVERAFYQRVVNTLLAVVVGLLGVAVVIALVGVANTLSLSVLERRRESATLRAIGLSGRQLRSTLAIEGMLIAGVGAVVGACLGTFYGWAGARTLLGEISPVGLTVPWRDLGLVMTVALLAGLLASVLPGRRAARTSPVEALAVE
ncbi:ABC transporter permease [Cellulomonas sp. KRMCY2]|uniref:ABC transporter permease n=1 Tax=Cellulomonas sp. KRMCY2 TaxID=1304865 RepID=UPI00045EA379|nr:FtsX-like permease family protein [Cellulomonas sp. KRMCY2]